MPRKSNEDFLSPVLEDPEQNARGLRLMPPREPRRRKFLGDLRYLLLPNPAPPNDAMFCRDVFVPSRLPWITFVESLVYHALAIVAMLLWAQWQPVRIREQDPWKETRVIVYPVQPRVETTDLPKLDTGSAGPHKPQTGSPTYARQPILSVPREPDNRAQTIVAPPDIVLHRDIRMPNIVAWTATTLPLAPAPEVPVLASQRRVLAPSISVVAPVPEVDPEQRKSAPRLQAVAVVPPSPQVETTPSRLGMMNVGRADPIAPAPQLPVSEQRAASETTSRKGQALAAGAVPPPPSIPSAGSTGSGRMIALSVNPGAPVQPLQPPAGNRRGEFSAAPQGNSLGSGRPTITESGNGNTGTGGATTVPGLPPGIRIGDPSAPQSSTADPGSQSMASITIDRHPIASIPPPRVDTANRKPATLSEREPTDAERKVFGPRRFYQMTLNMPNLNSAGGSWIVRFAELKDGPSKDSPSQGQLYSPLLTVKADPAYPSELQRENVQGTVTLYAIIHSDGTVRDIRILDGADDRLNQFAREALSRCRFEPALRDGVPVALQAVIAIPFRARKVF